MPKANITLWYPDSQFTQSQVDTTVEAAADIAASLGFALKTSKNAGRGNIAEMLGALSGGELAIFRVPFEELRSDGDEMNDLRGLAGEAHPFTAEILKSVIASLEEAIKRKEINQHETPP